VRSARTAVHAVWAALVVILAGCGTGTHDAATSTVTSTVLSTQLETSTTMETTVSVSVEVSTSVETSTSVAVVTATAPDPDTPGPVGGAACPADPSYYDEAPTGLDPSVIAAWQRATADAAAQGVTLCLHDGKRSRQQQLDTFDDYVAQYGEAAAHQYVLPPEKSAHVAGWAIDVQPASASSWLEATNGSYGLCRMYDNEAWHFEWAATFELGCPPRRAAPEG